MLFTSSYPLLFMDWIFTLPSRLFSFDKTYIILAFMFYEILICSYLNVKYFTTPQDPPNERQQPQVISPRASHVPFCFWPHFILIPAKFVPSHCWTFFYVNNC